MHTRFLLYWPARLRALGRKLEARGDRVAVVEAAGSDSTYAFATDPSAARRGLEWHCLFEGKDQKALRARQVSRAIWKALESISPDVVIATAIAFPTGATAVRWARQRRRGVVIMDDARLQDVPRSWFVNYVKRRIYRNVDAVLIPAPSHALSYAAWGVSRERTFYSTNVVDNERFARDCAATRERADSVRTQRGLPDRFFLGLGRQVAKKNWRTLLAAHGEYRREADDRPWDLVLVGDGPERNRLEAMVREEGVQGVHFLPACSPDDARVYYALAGALVLPSYYGETWGLVVNEAMACSLPVLVSDQCGCAESLVREGENGWTFPSDDEHALADLLGRVAALPEAERKAMGARSREIIAEWPLERFAEGATAAIDACKDVSRGFYSLGDRLLLSLWKGRYRPT